MEESEDHKSKSVDTEKTDFETGDDIATDFVTEEISGSVKETHDVNGSSLSTHVVDDSEKLEEDKMVLDSVVETEPVESLSQVAEDLVENSGVDSDVTDELESKFLKIMPLSDDNNGVSDSPALTDSVSRGIEAAIDGNTEVSPAVTDATSKGIEEATFPVSDENVGDSSGAADLVSKENVANLLQPADVPVANTCNDGESCNLSKVPKSTENQPLISVTPRARTSWMGCCGLFDIFKRSNQ